MEEGTRLGGGRAWSAVERVLLGLTFGCFGLMALAVAWTSADRLLAGEGSLPVKLLCLLGPALVLAGLAALCQGARESGAGRFALALFLGTLVLKGACAALVDTRPVSDFAVMYDAAVGLAREGRALTGQPYFQMWPYQSGPVVYLAALMKLFGEGLLWLKLVNALWAALTSVLVYALAGRFASEGGARAAAVVYTLYPGTWLLVPVLTNQHLSDLLFLLALWLYTTPSGSLKKRLGLAGAAGVALACGNAMRPVAVVALAAAGCLAVLETLRERRDSGRAAVQALARLLVLAAVYAGVMGAFGALTRLSGVNEAGLGSSCPEWKFVCGFNEETNGEYSEEDAALVFGSEDPRRTARELALERIKIPPARMMKLLDSKIKAMWGDYEVVVWTMTPNVERQIDASSLPVTAEQVNRWTRLLCSGAYVVCFLAAGLGGCAALFGRGRGRAAAQLLALSALAYFGVHLFIEVQPRYRLLMYAMAFPLAALGFDAVWALGERRKKGRTGPENTGDF